MSIKIPDGVIYLAGSATLPKLQKCCRMGFRYFTTINQIKPKISLTGSIISQESLGLYFDWSHLFCRSPSPTVQPPILFFLFIFTLLARVFRPPEHSTFKLNASPVLCLTWTSFLHTFVLSLSMVAKILLLFS